MKLSNVIKIVKCLGKCWTRKNIGVIGLATFFLLNFLPMTTILAQTQGTETGQLLGITYTCTGLTDSNGQQIYDCETFGSLMNAVQGITNFAVVNIALPFSVIVIIWAGAIYMRSGGSPTERDRANKMFVKVLWGIFWVLGAWLVINLIMSTLASSNVPQFLKNS